MNVAMKPHQVAFWRALLAPFPGECLSVTKRGGKELTYIDKRSIANRLDSVCGPHNWYPAYTETSRGLMCHLTIVCPMEAEGTWVAITKTDGAGPEEMGSENKQTHEWECDVDNDVKSNFTNAFRRAAQDAWGIGRYLYKKGIPDFLDPNASSAPEDRPTSRVESSRQADPAATSAATPAPTAPTPTPAPDGEKKKYDNFKIPKPGKSVFAWCKEMEKVFETRLVDGMSNDGLQIANTKVFADWDAAQVEAICRKTIEFLATVPAYKGQFDHMLGTAAPAPAPASAPAAPADATPEQLTVLRKGLAVKLTALIERQTGKAPTPAELKPALGNISPLVPTCRGVMGEVCESLAKCEDATWIAGMIRLVDTQIAASVQNVAADDVAF